MSLKKTILHYLAAYVMLVVSLGFGVFVLNMIRETILLGMVYHVTAGEPTKSDQFYRSLQVNVAYQWSYLFIGIIVIIIMVILENYYRTGVEAQAIWRRFFLVTGVEFGFLFITHAINTGLQMTFYRVPVIMVAVPISEGLLMGLFLWLWYNNQKVLTFLRR